VGLENPATIGHHLPIESSEEAEEELFSTV